MKLLAFIVLASLVLTGCGSEVKKELKYDEVELIHYKACVDYATNGYSRTSWVWSEQVTDQAIKSCSKYLPVKK